MNKQVIKDIARYSNRAWILMGVSFGVGGAIGTALGYHIAQRKLNEEYRAIVDKEIIEAQKYYASMYKREAFSSPNLVMKETDSEDSARHIEEDSEIVEDIIEEEEYDKETRGLALNNHTMIEKPNPRRKYYSNNIKNMGDLPERNENEPYILTFEEFMDDGRDNRIQATLTYYEDDDILADDREAPVEDIENTVGPDALTHFGYGSNDPHIVYVRNERLDIDFEIIRNLGNYTEIVHGIDQEPIRTSRRTRQKANKARGRDE